MYAICMLYVCYMYAICIAVYISPCVCKDFCLAKSRHFTRHLRVQRLDLRLLPQRKRYSLGCHGHSLTGDSYAHLCYHVYVYIYIYISCIVKFLYHIYIDITYIYIERESMRICFICIYICVFVCFSAYRNLTSEW
jgi:hypothetical protein